MITKEELLVQLERLRSEKKQAIPMYTQHLKDTSFLSQLKADPREEIKSMLLTLAEESEAHAGTFAAIAKKVKESQQDVY